MWKILNLLLMVFVLSACSSNVDISRQRQADSLVHNQVMKIQFAGFALSGDLDASKHNVLYSHNFPYASELMEEKDAKGMSVLDSNAQTAIKSVHNPRLEIMPSERLGDYKNFSDAMAAAVVVDSEDVTQEKVGDDFKIVITLRGQLLVFNFNERKVVASFPLTAELNHAAQKELKHDELLPLLKKLYVGPGDSFVKNLVDRLNTISINTNVTRGIQIKQVVFENDTVNDLKRKEQTQKDVETLVARNFEKYLSLNQGLSVIPHNKDASINAKSNSLATRFSNGDVLNLELPSPDYVISLTLKKLKKGRLGGNAVEEIFGYASIMNIKAELYDGSKTYLDVDVRYVLTVPLTVSMSNVDNRAHYVESIIQLFNTFTKQLAKPDSEWVETWVESKKDVAEQIEKFYEIINKCK